MAIQNIHSNEENRRRWVESETITLPYTVVFEIKRWQKIAQYSGTDPIRCKSRANLKTSKFEKKPFEDVHVHLHSNTAVN